MNIIINFKKALSQSYHRDTGKIIFLGDSLTRCGKWKSLLGCPITNCGIDGDTTAGVLGRINKVIAKEPEKIFLMVGINDCLALRGKSKNKSKILSDYESILKTLQKKLPAAKIYVQSMLPINSRLLIKIKITAPVQNKDIERLNNGLMQLCRRSGAFKYIDLYSSFAKDGQLNKRYTNDGLHLNSAGYELWRDLIRSHLECA